MTQKEIDKALAKLRKQFKAKEVQLDKLEDQIEVHRRAICKLEDKQCDIDDELSDLDSEIVALEAKEAEVDQVAAGEIPSPEQAKRIATQAYSYGVTFVRSKARKGKLVFTSDRRFSSAKEAKHHGKRFAEKHKHESFSVIPVEKKANAWVNWKTGKTNPAI